MTIANRHHVFCDESCTSARYVVLGGVITPADTVAVLDSLIQAWRADSGMLGELKWTKVSKAKLSAYREFVDLFFDPAKNDHLHFNAVVFDTSQVDYATYHKGDRELGVYKFYYTFLIHKFGPYAHDDTSGLWVFLDHR